MVSQILRTAHMRSTRRMAEVLLDGEESSMERCCAVSAEAAILQLWRTEPTPEKSASLSWTSSPAAGQVPQAATKMSCLSQGAAPKQSCPNHCHKQNKVLVFTAPALASYISKASCMHPPCSASSKSKSAHDLLALANQTAGDFWQPTSLPSTAAAIPSPPAPSTALPHPVILANDKGYQAEPAIYMQGAQGCCSPWKTPGPQP